jgi:hypothetical protein
MQRNLNLYFRNDRIKVLLLLLLVAVIYLPFLGNQLVFDDGGFFRNSISSFTNTKFYFTFRWFPYTTFGVTWVFFGENPIIYRVQNLLLHSMNVLLLLLVLRLWISLFVEEAARQHMANWGAWLGALVFACHPLAVYATGYLVQRSILMATLFTLVMHLAYFRGLIQDDKRYAALAVAAYFLAVFSKEHSLMVPAILAPMTWALRDQTKLNRSALLATWIGFGLIALIVLLRVKGVFGQVYEMDAATMFGQDELLKGLPHLHLLSTLTQAGLFFKYCLLMIVPNPAWMSIDMREPFFLSWRDWTNWIGILAFICYGIIALNCLLRGGRIALLGLALLYPWLLFFTEFTTIRVQEIFVLYRSYLWLPGFMLFLPLICSMIPDKKTILTGLIVALILVPLAWNRLWVFADNYRVWNDAVQLLHGEDRLGSYRTYYNRGEYAGIDNKNWASAIEDFKRSIQINSSFPEVRISLARAYSHLGRNQEALAEYDKAIAANPKNAEWYYEKGLFLSKMQNKAGALAEMKKSCELGKSLACMMVNFSRADKN